MHRLESRVFLAAGLTHWCLFRFGHFYRSYSSWRRGGSYEPLNQVDFEHELLGLMFCAGGILGVVLSKSSSSPSNIHVALPAARIAYCYQSGGHHVLGGNPGEVLFGVFHQYHGWTMALGALLRFCD